MGISDYSDGTQDYSDLDYLWSGIITGVTSVTPLPPVASTTIGAALSERYFHWVESNNEDSSSEEDTE